MIGGRIKGIHHITATVADAQADYDFYTKFLGLRLVKETINYDDESVYHFYYANGIGSPSTIFTTFPYQERGIRQGTPGAGQVITSAFSVSKASLPFWEKRLGDFSVAFAKKVRLGMNGLYFSDPSGLRLALIGVEADDRQPIWTQADVSEHEAIRGIHHAHMIVHDLGPTQDFLEAIGYTLLRKEGTFHLYHGVSTNPGDLILFEENVEIVRGKGGMGTVHHLAHRVDTREDLEVIREFLISEYDLKPTEIKDRKYFQSIYFRIPGGVLFEVATVGPGFTVDESEAALGTHLMLPEWQKDRREEIEGNLPAYIKYSVT